MPLSSLPTELLHQILTSTELPTSTRLTCRSFNALLTKDSFSTLRKFLSNPESTLEALQQAAKDIPVRYRPIWSPHCSVPQGLPLSRSFILAMYAALQGQSLSIESRRSYKRRMYWEESDSSASEWSSDEDEPWMDADAVTAAEALAMAGRTDLSEDTLREVMFRYALFLSYRYNGEGEAPQTWVLHTREWNKHV